MTSAYLNYDLARELAKVYEVTVLRPCPTRPIGASFESAGVEDKSFKTILLDSYTHPQSELLGRFRESICFGKKSAEYIQKHHKEIDFVYNDGWQLFGLNIVAKACKKFDIPYKTIGLTDTEVQKKIKQGKVNRIFTKTSKTYLQIFCQNFFTWFNLICFLIAGTLIAIKSYENILFIVIFLCNLFIGLFQEIKAKKIVDKISVFVEKKVEVLRNGNKTKIDIDKVVEGDILFFYAGDQICCDCKLIDGQVETNESLLTGESKPLKKNTCDLLLGGSFVVSGECVAIAEKVGMENYSSTLIKKARELKQNKSEILKTLNLIIKTIGFLLIPLGILTFIDLKNNGLV